MRYTPNERRILPSMSGLTSSAKASTYSAGALHSTKHLAGHPFREGHHDIFDIGSVARGPAYARCRKWQVRRQSGSSLSRDLTKMRLWLSSCAQKYLSLRGRILTATIPLADLHSHANTPRHRKIGFMHADDVAALNNYLMSCSLQK